MISSVSSPEEIEQMSGDPVSSTQSPNSQNALDAARRQREFIPEHKKDDKYWERRRKNNEAAKRSREKRRLNDVAMEKKIVELTQDNRKLQQELCEIKKRFGIHSDDVNHTNVQSESPSQQPPILAPNSHPPAGPPVPRLLPGPPNPFLPQSPRDLLALSRMVSPALFVPNQGPPVTVPRTTASLSQPNLILQSTASPSPATSLTIPVGVPSMGVPEMDDQPLDLTCRSVLSNQSPPATSSVKMEPNDLRVTTSAVPVPLGKHFNCNDVLPLVTNRGLAGTTPSPQLDRPLDVTMETMDRQDYKSDSSSVGSSISSVPPGNRPPSDLTMNSAAFAPSVTMAPVPQNLPSANASGSGHSSGPEDLSPISIDPRYIERRRRNNEAVRRCRENKRVRTQMRAEMSTILEVENRKLRLELNDLNTEVRELKNMLIDRQGTMKLSLFDHAAGEEGGAESASSTRPAEASENGTGTTCAGGGTNGPPAAAATGGGAAAAAAAANGGKIADGSQVTGNQAQEQQGPQQPPPLTSSMTKEESPTRSPPRMLE